MQLFEVILIAVGLAMDAFAVSISSGAVIKKVKVHQALLIASMFGLFQAGMPLLGWWLGNLVSGYIQHFDHWIAFGLLAFIGGKMIYESTQPDKDNNKNPLQFGTLLLMALATSIDALAVGVSFSLLEVKLLLSVLIIGTITLIISFAGVYIGKKAGHIFEDKAELIGGLILVAIGLKILIEHLCKGC